MIYIYITAQKGTYEEFKKIYTKDTATTTTGSRNMTILQYIVLNDTYSKDRIKMIEKVIKDGVDVNHICSEHNRNVLHLMYMNFRDKDYPIIFKITKLLIDAGIDVNAKDGFNNIPMKYAIAVLKSTTEELTPLYKLLLDSGSEYKNVDKFGKSCLDYAKEYSWRNGFIDIVKEFENE